MIERVSWRAKGPIILNGVDTIDVSAISTNRFRLESCENPLSDVT